MSSEKYHYEAGATHNDHHKEINIGYVSEKALGDIISNFMKSDAEDAEYEEVVEQHVIATPDEPAKAKAYGTPMTDDDYKAIVDLEKKNNEALKQSAQQEYRNWLSTECYGSPTVEKLLNYRLRLLLELFASGIFSHQVSKMVATEKRPNEIDFDMLDEADERRMAWRNYAALRDFFDFEAGMLRVRNSSRVGRLFYQLADDKDADVKIAAFFRFSYKLVLVQKKLQEVKAQSNERAKMLTEKRQMILDAIDAYIEKGEWVLPATEDNIKQMMRNVLNLGDYVLEAAELELSKALWELFESREGDATAVTWQNIIGYLYSYQLLPQSKGSSQLQKMFFGRRDLDKYTNIDKGKISSSQMPAKFKKVLPLLDKYRVKPE